MSRFIKQVSKSKGRFPGELVHIGEQRTGKVKITIMDFDENHFQEKEAVNIGDCFPFKETSTVTWINIDGIHDVNVVEELGRQFDIHPLVLEDILDTGQRPKTEDFEDYLFIVLKMLYVPLHSEEVIAEQVSLVIGRNFVISFQEKEGDVFNHVRERIRNAKGRVRKMGADYLAYSLVDAIVDNYFLILEKFGEKTEDVKEELISNPNPRTLQEIHNLKRDALFLRKAVWPLREVISTLERTESALIQESTGVFLRDVYDHTIQVIDTVEAFRDMASGMLDIYLSSLSNKMNEIMKVLTIIATIFIPLTFIVGIYGMNFNPDASPWNMPELNWRYGYAFAWGIMLAVVFGMLVYFRRKKWI